MDGWMDGWMDGDPWILDKLVILEKNLSYDLVVSYKLGQCGLFSYKAPIKVLYNKPYQLYIFLFFLESKISILLKINGFYLFSKNNLTSSSLSMCWNEITSAGVRWKWNMHLKSLNCVNFDKNAEDTHLSSFSAQPINWNLHEHNFEVQHLCNITP